MHISKRKTELSKSPHKFMQNSEPFLMCAYSEFEHITSLKNVGVSLDECLTFECHKDKLIGKLYQRTGMKWRLHNTISKSFSIQLCKSLIQPHLIYCSLSMMNVVQKDGVIKVQ